MKNHVKKIIPYVFLLIALLGVFGYVKNVKAQDVLMPSLDEDSPAPVVPGTGGTQQIKKTNSLEEEALNSCANITQGSVGGCLITLSYYILVGIPSFLLALSARFLDFMIPVTLNTTMYGTFIGQAWTIVRDLSNVFFIIILLYIGIKTILGMGGSETKTMVANVIIMAILINFSMFFTKVVIDSSNVVALIFYKQISVQIKDQGGALRDIQYSPIIDPSKGTPDKDIAGALIGKFNISKMIDASFFDRYRETNFSVKPGLNNLLSAGVAAKVGVGIAGLFMATPPGIAATAAIATVAGGVAYIQGSFSNQVPIPLMLSVIVVCGAIMIAATYAFVVSGLSFLGRLIELWILIIFSPFAFMSFSLPSLAHIEYLGWDNWSKRLLSASFMAPIFMFFLYLISLIVENNPLNSIAQRAVADQEWMEFLILLVVPVSLVIAMLLKAADFAKKGSGQAGELVMSGAKMLAGLAVGGAAIGTAYAGRKIVGNSAAALSKRSNVMATLKFDQEYKKWVAGGSPQGAQPVSTAQPLSLLDRAGLKISRSQLESGEVAHAVHERDELKKSAGVEGLSDDQISSTDEMRMESEFVKKHKKDIEDEIRAGIGSDGKAITINQPKDKRGAFLVDRNGNPITAIGEEDFKAQRRQKLLDIQQANRGPNVPLEDSDRKRVEGQLNTEFAAILRGMLATEGSLRYEHLKDEALNKKLGVGTQILAKSTSGSYDPRKLADVRPGKTDSMSAKIGLGIIAAVATGMRLGLKQGAGVSSGTSQRDLLKDLGNTISEAFKSAKINVDFGGGHGGGHDDSHKTSGGGHH